MLKFPGGFFILAMLGFSSFAQANKSARSIVSSLVQLVHSEALKKLQQAQLDLKWA